MMLKTAALIAAIDATAERYEADMKRHETEHAAAVIKHREKWLADNTELFRLALDRARRALREGRPITSEMFPTTGRFNDIPFYSEPTSFASVKRAPSISPQLASLRAALEAIADDTVGTSTLATLGYRDLSWLFSAAVAAGGAA